MTERPLPIALSSRLASQPAAQLPSRPEPQLLTQYIITSLFAFVAAPIVIVPLYFRYHTLRYRFDDDGIHASWGILFRKEVSLTYARIQDIHLKRNVLERWLGIGSVHIQTASGASSAELVIEGIKSFVEVRDFLYDKMRGARGTAPASVSHVDDEAIALLKEIRDDLRAVRTLRSPMASPESGT